MRKIIILPLLLFAAAIFFTATGTAQTSDTSSKSLKEVLAEIRQSQNLDADQPIDCNKVSDRQFEELGEAWMDVMVPDPQRHAMMDRMMGGEGSESLAQAHRMMGARYLGCIDAGAFGGMIPGMTGGAGMMPGMMGGRGLMSGYRNGGHMYGYGNAGWMHSWAGGIMMWVILLAVIGLIIYLIFALSRSHRDSSGPTQYPESAHEILKKRYARGEISKEDFERMKKDIA